ncbi:hypothetical protein [Alteromonas sp. AMM-1]|uniref:hypothetical protein n=1 Tax=Alteromonas sp. AMM-1 TaxID=3394233 RepID=UPI0039A53896
MVNNASKVMIIVALFIGVLGMSPALAVEQSATAKISYGGWGLDSDEKKEAEQAALRKAIETYIAEVQQAHFRNYKKVKAEIDKNIESYFLDYVVTDANEDKDDDTYEVTVRGTINEPMLMAKLISSGDEVDISKQAYLTFVFVAREIAETTSTTNESTSNTKSQGKGIAQSGTDETTETFKSKTETASIKTENKRISDVISYRVATANEVDVAMGNVFTNANYLVIDAAMLEEETDYLLDVNSFIEDYQTGNDLSSKTKGNALKGLRGLEDPIDYMAIGTLDIDEQQTNEQTGMYRISVSVTGQILSVRHRGAAVAKVGPVQYFGEGPTLTVAKNNALKLAAEEAAQELVAMLSGKNIR